jgi:hypothetical protein
VQFRFHFFSDGSNNNFNGWAIDNFQITAPAVPNDVGVIAVLQPSAPTQTGTPVTVQVTIRNFGTNTQTSIPVRYFINASAVISETWTGSLLPNATVNYTFTTPFTSPGSPYSVCSFTRLTGDPYWWNDSTCVQPINVTPGDNDVGISKILEPVGPTVSGQTYTVKVSIKNYGLNTQTSIPLIYTKNGVGVGAGTYNGTPLNTGDTAIYTFTQTFVAPIGNYSLCSLTQLVGDANPVNDNTCNFPNFIETYDYSSFQLLQNIPNPSNNRTAIVFIVPADGKVRFDMIDLLGNTVMTKEIDATNGKNQLDVDVSRIPAGIYFYSAQYNDQKRTKRMVITK